MINWKLHLLSPKISCSLKKIFAQFKIILEGTLILSNLKLINKIPTLPSPLEKFLRTPMNNRAFSLSFFRAFTHYELFLFFLSLDFDFKLNTINPHLVIILSKLPAITNVIHNYHGCCTLFQTKNKNYRVPHLKSTDLNRIQVTTLACCNIQVKQRYCSVLATVTGNCAVTNVIYNENKYYAITLTFYLESSMYLSRCQWLRQIVVMCHVACWFRSGAVLKFDQFYHSSFFLNQP